MKMQYQEQIKGFLSILSSLDNRPIEQILDSWQSKVKNGHIKRLTDYDIQLPVFELAGININHNYISIPKDHKNTSLKIKLPILVLLIKNMDKYFKFQVQIKDSDQIKRTFISCNHQSITKIKPFECSMPLDLDDGWNEIIFDLQQYCFKAFGTHYLMTEKVQIFANCRIARVYFNDVKKNQDQIPADYKLFIRVQSYQNN